MKRFTDTELFDKTWFMDLSCRLKCAVRYLFDKCDNAGVWTPNYLLAAVYVGEAFTEEEILKIDGGEQFEKFGEKIFVKGFIDFQYGELTENCKPHRAIIQKLKKYGLYERVLKGYCKGIDTLQEKDKDKEKEQEKNLGKSENPFKNENFLIPEMQKIFKEKIPQYFPDDSKDYEPILKISEYIAKIYKIPENILAQSEQDRNEICRRWGEISEFISQDEFFKNYSLMQIEKHFQSIFSKFKNGSKKLFTKSKNSKSAGAYQLLNEIKSDFGI